MGEACEIFWRPSTSSPRKSASLIVEQAIKLLEEFYVHLPMKRAMHAVDPLQRLRLLQRRLPQLTSEIAFHHEMTEIFTSLRVACQLHSAHALRTDGGVPAVPRRSLLRERRARVHRGADRAGIQPSHLRARRQAHLLEWHTDRSRGRDRRVYHAGSNPAARHARGVAGLTKRAMNIAPPPG